MTLTHFNEHGRAKMVDVGDKEISRREAVARGRILMKKTTRDRIKEGKIGKGDVLGVAQVAAIMAAKKTSELIPMCHNIFLTGADIDFLYLENGIEVISKVRTDSKTGVEMEALNAVSAACLTIYDMCKAIDKEMEITDIVLLKKTGGKSSDFNREAKEARVVSINISKEKGVIKEAIREGSFLIDFGLEGDAHGGNWHRQVSLLDLSSFKKMQVEGVESLKPGIFAENITTEGLCLYKLPLGTKLKIGESIQELTQIGKKCHDGCEISKIVGKCIMPQEGIFTRVIKSGKVKVGDKIEILD